MSPAVSYEEVLHRVALERPELVVMTAENRAPVRGLPSKLGARFIDVGIAEQTLVGMAAGLAQCGRIPVVHALAAFLTMRAFEFIRTDVGIGGLPVKLVGFVPGVLSDGNGPTHQALEDIALMRGIPGMQVFCPADAWELQQALPALIAAPGPCYVRYTALPRLASSSEELVPGRASVLHRGSDVTLLTFGALLGPAEEARRRLEATGLSVGLINLRWLAPLDEAAVLRAASECRQLVTIEDHFLVGGLYAAVAVLLQRAGMLTRLTPIGFAGHWFAPGRLEDVLEHAGLSGAGLARRIEQALGAKES